MASWQSKGSDFSRVNSFDCCHFPHDHTWMVMAFPILIVVIFHMITHGWSWLSLSLLLSFSTWSHMDGHGFPYPYCCHFPHDHTWMVMAFPILIVVIFHMITHGWSWLSLSLLLSFSTWSHMDGHGFPYPYCCHFPHDHTWMVMAFPILIVVIFHMITHGWSWLSLSLLLSFSTWSHMDGHGFPNPYCCCFPLDPTGASLSLLLLFYTESHMDSHRLPRPPGRLSRTTTGHQDSNLWCPHRHSWVHWPSPDPLWRLPCDLCGDLWPTRICDKRCSGGAPDDPSATWPCCGGKVCAGGQFALDLWHHYRPILRCPDPEPLQFKWWHQSGLPYTPSWWAASSCPLSCVCLVCQKTARFHRSIFVTWNLFGSRFCFLYVNTAFRSGDKKKGNLLHKDQRAVIMEECYIMCWRQPWEKSTQ